MSQLNEPYGAADGLVRVYPATADARTTADAAAARPRPGLVWAHGGGFAAGDLDMPEAHWVASSLAARGITVVSIEYRLTSSGFHYPAPSDDVLAAWRWTVDHADELGIDPARIVIGGASAGGNLAAGAVLRLLEDRRGSRSDEGASRSPIARNEGFRDGAGAPPQPAVLRAGAPPQPAGLPTGAPPQPAVLPAGVFLAYPTLLAEQPAPDAALRALLDANPAADHPASYVTGMYERYFGGPVDEAPLAVVPGRAAASDLDGFPPVLMINSEIDYLRVSGEVFAATLREAGVPLELVTEPGTGHGHLNRPDEPAASASIDRIVRWIDTLTTLRTTEGTST